MLVQSDANYITHEAAERLGLAKEEMELVMSGIGGLQTMKTAFRYLLMLENREHGEMEGPHRLHCYGLDKINRVIHPVRPEQLRRFFPHIRKRELAHPGNIDLWISIRKGQLVPHIVQHVGDLALWDGPLGKTVVGTHLNLFEKLETAMTGPAAHPAKAM